jgi:uncharacterized membrane protein YeaQ/YmgE (transglycosylase-associated protein family)
MAWNGGRILALLEANMTLTVSGLIILVIIAAICGAIGRSIAGGKRHGILMSVALGFIGALLGSAIGRQLHLPEPLMLTVSGERFPILWSIIGAALFVAIVHLISGRR